MALFIKKSKTSLASQKGKIVKIETFEVPVSQDYKHAVSIKMIGEDGKEYSLTLYNHEADNLKLILNKYLP